MTKEELVDARRAAKILQLRLHRVGHERLLRHTSDGGLLLSLARTDAEPNSRTAPVDRPVPEWGPRRPRTAEFLGRRVPAPSRVTSQDPLVLELETAADWLERSIHARWHHGFEPSLPRRPRQRMRRIWQALIVEARFRGYDVMVRHNRRDAHDRGALVIEIGWDDFPLALDGDPGQPLRLRLIEGHQRRRQRESDSWVDSPQRPLHTMLGEVFTFIEQRADLLVEARDEEHRRALEARRARETAEHEAWVEFAEDHRRAVLAARVTAVAAARDARRYAAALVLQP